MASMTRRTFALGAMWATPAVLASTQAPAVSASTHNQQGIDWNFGTYTETMAPTPSHGDEVIAFTFVPTACPGLTITGTTTRYLNSRGTGHNFHRENITGTYSSGLVLNYQANIATGYASRTEWEITFTPAVTGLQLAITDIDWDGTNPATTLIENRENVTITPLPATAPTLGSKMSGAGTLADPWVSVNNFQNTPNGASNVANVGLSYGATAISSITITAWSMGLPATQQNIFLSTLALDCPP
ncbi:MAG: hypothetical protein ACK5LN_04145 [Propioniciclava sp.]